MQPEVARLRDEGRIEEFCDFGGGRRFSYALESSAVAAKLNATFDSSLITVIIPSSTVVQWAEGTEVGIYGVSGVIEFAIEKDFQCISRHGHAEEPEAFPNPAAAGYLR